MKKTLQTQHKNTSQKKIQTKKRTGRKKTGQHTKTEQEELKDIHSNHGSCGKNIRRAYTEKKNCQAAQGSGNTPVYLRPRRQTEAVANHPPEPSRCHPQKKNRPSTQGGVSCLTNPRPGLGKIKGLRRRPKSYETYKAPRAGFAMPTVGVTVLPKRVLAKHRTNQTTNCHSPAKKRKSRSSDHQQHKQKMKETKRKQKHPSWVVRVRQGRRDATATQQTTQRCPKDRKNTKMKKAEKIQQEEKEDKPVYTYTHTNTLHTQKHTN